MEPTMEDAVMIRPVALADADAVAALSGELGYPTSAEAMRARLETLTAMPDHGVFVACRDGAVLGWIHVAAVLHLQSEPRAEIGGLVVTSSARSQRVGARLVAAAEQWARDHGFTTIVVRSQIKREEAHRFYLREGYERTKTSAVFTKPIVVPAPAAR
ncbi:MAG: GNAT family N-acetyltransferase [Vicinamibacterales bacterium]